MGSTVILCFSHWVPLNYQNKQEMVGSDLRHSLLRVNVQVNFSYLVSSKTVGMSSMGRLSPLVCSWVRLVKGKGEQEREPEVGH